MESSVSEIHTITQYHYLGDGMFRPYISLEDYIFKVLSEGPMTRGEMSQKTGIPRTTLYDTLTKLRLKEEIKRFNKTQGRGRPRVYYILRKHALNTSKHASYTFY